MVMTDAHCNIEVKKTEKDGFNFLRDLHEIDSEIIIQIIIAILGFKALKHGLYSVEKHK